MILVWSIVIVAALIIEIITVGNLVSIWFSMAAVVSLILAIFNVSDVIQILMFALVSIALILTLRPIATNYFRGNIIATNVDALIGRTVHLSKEIGIDSWGETKVNGVIWHAASFDGSPIANQTLVSVLAIEGAKLIVKSVD